MNLSAIEDIVKDSIPYSKSEILDLIADLSQRSLEQQKPQIDDIGKYLEKFKDEILKEYYLIFQNYSVEPSICIEKAQERITELHKQIEDQKKIFIDSPGIIESVVYQLPEDWEGPSDSRPLWSFRKTVAEKNKMPEKLLAYVKLRSGIKIDLLESLLERLSSEATDLKDDTPLQSFQELTSQPVRALFYKLLVEIEGLEIGIAKEFFSKIGNRDGVSWKYLQSLYGNIRVNKASRTISGVSPAHIEKCEKIIECSQINHIDPDLSSYPNALAFVKEVRRKMQI